MKTFFFFIFRIFFVKCGNCFLIFFSHRNLIGNEFKCDCKIQWIWAEMSQKVHLWKQDVIGLNKFNNNIKAISCVNSRDRWKKITDTDIGLSCSRFIISFYIIFYHAAIEKVEIFKNYQQSRAL